jgi:hypothetical protein
VQPPTSDDLDPIARWHFAVGGVRTKQARLPVNKAIELRSLTNYPQPTELVLCLRDLVTAGFMAHYGESGIQHELVVDAAEFTDYEEVVKTAGLVMAGLRIRTEADIICPAVCERSWADLKPTADSEPCRAYRVEQIKLDHPLETAYTVTPEDLEWVARSLAPLWELAVVKKEEDERFATAVEALCSYLHAGNYRMMAAQLWAGIEAIFDVQLEVKYRIATLAACLLEPQGARRRERYERVKKLYDERSRAVHGKRVSEDKFRAHVAEVRSLLAQILARLIARGKVPTKDDFDDLVFLPDRP